MLFVQCNTLIMKHHLPVIFFVIILILWQQPEATAQTDTTNYGKAPDVVLPYGRFQQQPNQHFFADPQPFLGPGREKKPPTDLETVRIGFLGPLEGSMILPLGMQMLHGTMLAIEEANEKGGYNGIPFELMPHNDVGLWGAAANEVVKMSCVFPLFQVLVLRVFLHAQLWHLLQELMGLLRL